MRRFAIPSLAALSGSLTGCSDPIVGEWICSEYDDMEMPYEYSMSGTTYYGEAISYTYSVSLGLRVFSDLTGHFTYTSSYSVSGAVEASSSGGFAGRIELSNEGDREYTIELDGSDSELECELTKDELDCEDEDEDDFSIVFERAED